MAENGELELRKQHKTLIQKETVFLWADLKFLLTKKEITQEDFKELTENYFEANCRFNLPNDILSNLREVLLNGNVTKEDLEAAEKEIFHIIDAEMLKNSIFNFATASVYCKRLREEFVPLPESVFLRTLPMIDDDSWQLITKKRGVTIYRKKRDFAVEDYFVSKCVVPLNVPKESALDILDVHFRVEQDPAFKKLVIVEHLGPGTDIIYCKTKNFIIKRDYCYIYAKKTLDNGWDVALSASIDHVKAPEKKGLTRGFIPLFSYTLRPIDQNSCEFVELSFLSLEGQKMLSMVTSSDFLMSGFTSRLIKVRDAILKQNKVK